MAKYNNNTYIEKAKNKWGDRFDYSLINYINSYHKIKVKCKKHNTIFEVDPISFIRENKNRKVTGNFCPKCKINPKMTHDEFMNKIQKYSDLYDLSEVKFKTTRDSVKLKCSNHGIFYIEARHLSCKGLNILCPKCKNSNSYHPNKIISEQEDAVFYKIIVEHKETKLKWLKIGITSYTTEQRYKKYKGFNIEVLEEIFDTGTKVIELEKKYKEENKNKRFYIPHYINFNGRTECYIIDNELQLKSTQVKFIRDAILEKQNGICPLCNNEVKMPTLDHSHSKKHNGDGLIRGVLCNNCNRMIGVIENKAVMNGISFSDLPNFLRSCADYAEKMHYPMIHPSEVPKPKKLSKKNYNKCKKIYEAEEFIPKRKNQKKKPFPEYPKSGKATKALVELFEKYQIELFN